MAYPKSWADYRCGYYSKGDYPTAEFERGFRDGYNAESERLRRDEYDAGRRSGAAAARADYERYRG